VGSSALMASATTVSVSPGALAAPSRPWAELTGKLLSTAVLAQGEQAARTDVVLSPGAQLSMASVNKVAACWAWRSLGSLSAVAGAELGRALGAVRVAAGVLGESAESAYAAGNGNRSTS
jgi:hypothetical protein